MINQSTARKTYRRCRHSFLHKTAADTTTMAASKSYKTKEESGKVVDGRLHREIVFRYGHKHKDCMQKKE